MMKEEILLERFRTRHAELKAAHSQARLYALVDPALLPDNWRHYLRNNIGDIKQYSLYANSGLDSLSENGPFTIACPDLGGGAPATVLSYLCSLIEQDYRIVSWIWTAHDIEPLIEHLQTLLHAQLGPENEDAWFFFYQPTYLPILHRGLPADTKRYMFGSCLTWWCFDSQGELIELAGENLPLPHAWDALPIPGEIIEALHREGASVQTRAWLKGAMADLFDADAPNEQLGHLKPLIDKACVYGITDKVNLGVYAAFGLQYGNEYDEHPTLQAVLSTFRPGRTSLINEYCALDGAAWREVEATAVRREREAKIRAYHEELKECGYVSIPVRLINEKDYQLRNLRIAQSRSQCGLVSSLGDLDAGWFRFEAEVKSAYIPVPGMKAVFSWQTSFDHEFTVESTVTGELPNSPDTGIAIVRFAPNNWIGVSMHAEEPKPVGIWKSEG